MANNRSFADCHLRIDQTVIADLDVRADKDLSLDHAMVADDRMILDDRVGTHMNVLTKLDIVANNRCRMNAGLSNNWRRRIPGAYLRKRRIRALNTDNSRCRTFPCPIARNQDTARLCDRKLLPIL